MLHGSRSGGGGGGQVKEDNDDEDNNDEDDNNFFLLSKAKQMRLSEAKQTPAEHLALLSRASGVQF